MSAQSNNDRIQRYSVQERMNHGLVAVTFVLLALSGLALFHPSLFWLTGLFGGGTWARILHPFIGVVMFVSFLGLMFRFWHHNILTKDDRVWLSRVGDFVNNREDRLPPVGRYNGGQKLLFWIMVLCLLALLVSGVPIWRAYFSGYFPIGTVRFASVVHALFGLILILGIVVHVYAAIWIKGSIRAMTRGTVSRGWAHKHHRAWFRQVVRGGRSAE